MRAYWLFFSGCLFCFYLGQQLGVSDTSIQATPILLADAPPNSKSFIRSPLSEKSSVASAVSPRKDAECLGSTRRYPSIAEDTSMFEHLAHRCTDKVRAHRYQHIYPRMLYPMRHEQVPRRMLEVGLGCDMRSCVAGGARLFMSFFPQQYVSYHTLEFDPPRCRSRYNESSVDAAMAAYIERHLCSGSSADLDVLERCGKRFGPFDLIIDDASHYQWHVMTAFQFWFPSRFLKPGGTYLVEDLQVIFWDKWETRDAVLRGTEKPPADNRHYHQLVTFGNVLQSVLLCKYSKLLCGNRVSGELVKTISGGVSRVVISKESGGFRKR